MILRQPVPVLEGKVSKSESYLDFLAVCITNNRSHLDYKVSNFLEIGVSKSQTALLEELGWRGICISDKIDSLGDRETKLMKGDHREINLRSVCNYPWNRKRWFHKEGYYFDAIFIDFESDEQTLEYIKKQEFLDWRIEKWYRSNIIFVRTHRQNYEYRKLLGFYNRVCLAKEIDGCWDVFIDPIYMDNGIYSKFAYDYVTSEELIYNHDLSHVVTRDDEWSQEKNVDYWAKHFLNYD